MIRADFDSRTAQWTATVEHDGKQFDVTCDFLFGATGYYDYAQGTPRTSRGQEDFAGGSCTRSSGRRTWTTTSRSS